MSPLDLSASSADLTRAICDIPSVSGEEGVLADAIHDALRGLAHLTIHRDGDTIVARTDLGRERRVVIAGHIDTVPINGNVPTRDITEDGRPFIWGRGTVDMKAGVAVQLKLAAELIEPQVDITWMWYDHEEVDADLNGLTRLSKTRPDLFAADFAILGEPSDGEVEGGCNGNLRAIVRTTGVRAHSARAWIGENAIHKAAPVLARLAEYQPREVPVEGLVYREGLNAVRISGGVAGNVIPDLCEVEVNYRFAPSRTAEEAAQHVRDVFAGYEVEVVDIAAGARPGLDAALAREFVAAVGAQPKPKYGWTDVARFSALGVPAVNYGPGNPHLAHHDEERVAIAQIEGVERGLRAWLTSLLTPTAQRRRVPVAASIAIVYLLARLVTTGMLLVAAELSGPASRFGAHATIGELMAGWDAQWYWFVAVHGYPTEVPLTDSGLVAENQWAFMPLFAYLAAVLGALVNSWIAGAVAISLVSGYLACLVLYRITTMHADRTTGMWTVAFFAAAPLAALFQVGYAEALFLLWLFLALWVVLQRRYAWLYLLVPLMGLTRPGVLAFALFLGLHGIHRWVARRREPLPLRQIVHIVATGILGVIVGFAWQVAAGIVTGDSGAYLATELAWRRNWLPDPSPHFLPFDGFLQGAGFWFETWGLGAVTGYVAVSLGVLGVAALLLFEPHVRRLGVDLRLWGASYLVYLLAVFFPQSSIFRLLIPLSPLWGAAAMPKSTAWRVAVLCACLLGQWWWIYNMYALGNTFWQIP